MQDNDPKHTSHYAANFLDLNCINWQKIPAELPDFNPIENLWHKLKEYICREMKPKTKAELIDGIKTWATVTVEKCIKYIRHLRKVIPRAIELNGDATGYLVNCVCYNINASINLIYYTHVFCLLLQGKTFIIVECSSK